MRIAMLAWESLHSVAVGGVAQHVTELAAALQRRGHDVHVFTRIAPGQSDYACHDGVHYYRCAYQGHNEFVDDVNNMCRAFVQRMFGVEDSTGKPFDIVHAHDWLCANAMIWAKKARPRRGLFTVHATEYARSGNVFHNGRSARVREQERAGTYWADHVIAVSHATRKEIMWMYEVPDWKSSVVYNGVTRSRFDRAVDVGAVRRKYDLGPMDPVVLFCGRLDFQKGPDIALEAMPHVLHNYRNAKLVFAGDGGMRHHLERRAQQLGVAHAVRFLGYRNGDEIVDIFKSCDVVTIPSRNEPFGIVVLEAWCAGKPVLVTHTGGPSEYVTHGENGLRIYDNPHSVAWGIHQLFGDFDCARWMGARGRAAVDHGFTWDLVAEQTLRVYRPEDETEDEAEAEAEAKPDTEAEADAGAEGESNEQDLEPTLRVARPAHAPEDEAEAEAKPETDADADAEGESNEQDLEPTTYGQPAAAQVEATDEVNDLTQAVVENGTVPAATDSARVAGEREREAEPATEPTAVESRGGAVARSDADEPPTDDGDAAAHAPGRLEIELALHGAGDRDVADAQLRRYEQVLRRSSCHARHDNGSLIVAGDDWQALFEAVREACRTFGEADAHRLHARLTLTAELTPPQARYDDERQHDESSATDGRCAASEVTMGKV